MRDGKLCACLCYRDSKDESGPRARQGEPCPPSNLENLERHDTTPGVKCLALPHSSSPVPPRISPNYPDWSCVEIAIGEIMARCLLSEKDEVPLNVLVFE